MIIPKTIQIAGKKITIRFDNAECDREKSYGLANHHRGEITLQDTVQGIDKRSQDSINETFIHEIIHAIYSALGEDHNEKFISGLSVLLYQVIKQIEGKRNV